MNVPHCAPRRVAVLACALFLSACAGTRPAKDGPAPVEEPQGQPAVSRPAPTPPSVIPAPEDPGAAAAYQPLLARAQVAAQRGDYEQAFALLERAQRIDPDSAEVYLAMAQTHIARGDRARAAVTAERGLLYCRGKAQCDALRAFID